MSAYAQISGNLVASVSSSDKLAIVKNSLVIPAWHERNFWPVYEDYLSKSGQFSAVSNRHLSQFSTADFDKANEDAYHQGKKMLDSRYDVLTVRQRYYASIASSFNGIIALQFVQTEALFDMMEQSAMYDASRWKNFKYRSSLDGAKANGSKYNMIKAALDIPKEQSDAFWQVYKQYEEESSALLGDNYNMIALYSSEPGDFTPALAKRLAGDFLTVMERELKVKQKYFDQMNLLVGPALAAGFLAWEDYYSLQSKMHVWLDN